MYPNVVFLTHNKKITFHSGISDIKVNVYHKKLIRDLKKNLLIDVNKNSAIVILNQIYDKLEGLIEEIKTSSINKIYFFIDDVFRIKHLTDSQVNLLDTHTIEKDFDNTVFLELELINTILSNTFITDFKIFHCEKIPKFLNRKFKYKISYFDIYLNNWVYYKKNDDYIKNLPIDFKITCFNHRRDWHRHLISALLHDQKDVFLSNSNKYSYDQIINNPYINFNTYEDSFKAYFLNQIKKYDALPVSFVDENGSIIKKNSLRFGLNDHLQNSESIFNLIEKSFINLVTETRFYTPLTYISEKTLKPIMVNRPFITIGPPHTLKTLKNMGFKTFNKWWDESYDNELDHNKRFLMIYEVIQDLLLTDPNVLFKMLEEMKPVLMHNRKNIKQVSKYFFKNLII